MRITILELNSKEYYDSYGGEDFYYIVRKDIPWTEVTEDEYKCLNTYLEKHKYVIVKELPPEEIRAKVDDYLKLARKVEADQLAAEKAAELKRTKTEATKLKKKKEKELARLEELAKSAGLKLVKE